MGQTLVGDGITELERLAEEADIPERGPCAWRIDPERATVAVRDRRRRTVYALGMRPTGGYGWMAAYEEPGGWVLQTWTLSAAEPMAMVRDLGGEEAVVRRTLQLAERLDRGPAPARRAARRLRREVAAGNDRELMAVRPIQAAVLRRQVEQGLTLSDLCHRGGFVGADGGVDVSWLERRAGLKPEVCSRTGRRRHRRVVEYGVFVRLVAAVDGEPIDFGA